MIVQHHLQHQQDDDGEAEHGAAAPGTDCSEQPGYGHQQEKTREQHRKVTNDIKC